MLLNTKVVSLFGVFILRNKIKISYNQIYRYVIWI